MRVRPHSLTLALTHTATSKETRPSAEKKIPPPATRQRLDRAMTPARPGASSSASASARSHLHPRWLRYTLDSILGSKGDTREGEAKGAEYDNTIEVIRPTAFYDSKYQAEEEEEEEEEEARGAEIDMRRVRGRERGAGLALFTQPSFPASPSAACTTRRRTRMRWVAFGSCPHEKRRTKTKRRGAWTSKTTSLCRLPECAR